jgi:hypothetical protein
MSNKIDDTEAVPEETSTQSAVAKIAPELYQDALKPAAIQVGKALETVGEAINAVLAPVRLTVWGFDQIETMLKERLQARLAGVAPDELKTPPANVLVPAIEALRYTAEIPELRDMYVALIASSMQGKAHPAFAETIRQMSPSEARFLRDQHPVGPNLIAWLCTPKVTDRDENYERKSVVRAFELDNLERLNLIQVTRMNFELGKDGIFHEFRSGGGYSRLSELNERVLKKSMVELGAWDRLLLGSSGCAWYVEFTDFGYQFYSSAVETQYGTLVIVDPKRPRPF